MATFIYHDDFGRLYCATCGEAKEKELIRQGKLKPVDEVDDPFDDPITCHEMEPGEWPFTCDGCGKRVTPEA